MTGEQQKNDNNTSVGVRKSEACTEPKRAEPVLTSDGTENPAKRGPVIEQDHLIEEIMEDAPKPSKGTEIPWHFRQVAEIGLEWERSLAAGSV